MPATDLPAAPAQPAKRGRPRSAEADEAILTAALTLVTEVGIGGLSIDDIASRAGVSKATIYRRWESKEALILDALNSGLGRYEPVDTGSVLGDLRTYIGTIAEKLRNGAKTRDLIPHLIAAATSNPALEPALDDYSRIRTQPLRELFERAVRRGELPADTDVTIAIEMFLGAMSHRRLFSDSVYDGADAERLVTYVLRALSAGE